MENLKTLVRELSETIGDFKTTRQIEIFEEILKEIEICKNTISDEEYEELSNECIGYLEDLCGWDEDWSNFDLEEMSNELDIDPRKLTVFICNLEDEKVAREILEDGEYDNFDIHDSSIFNDGYSDIISDMIS